MTASSRSRRRVPSPKAGRLSPRRNCSNIDNGLILRTNSEGKTEESLLEEYKALKNIESKINKEFEKINIGLLYDVNSILKKAVTLLDDSVEEFIIDGHYPPHGGSGGHWGVR